MLMVNHLIGFGVEGGSTTPDATCTYIGTLTYSSAPASPSTHAFDLGTAASNRVIVVGVGGRNTHSDMTIGGVTATKILTLSNTTILDLWYAAVPSGSGSQNIVITHSGGVSFFVVTVWSITTSTPAPTLSGSSTADPGTYTPATVNAGGLVIGWACRYTNATSVFTGGAFDVEDVDSVVDANKSQHGYHRIEPSGSTSTLYQIDYSSSVTEGGACFAVWDK